MSEDLLRKIQIGHEGFSQGDLSEAKTNLAADVEWSTTGTWPGLEGTYRSPDALEEWMRTLRSEWETFTVSLGEVIRDDGDVMVITERLAGRGRESGIEVEMLVFSVYWSEGGKIVKRRSYRSSEEALAAAGVEAG
jgi:ketosteroid isomerase-like protein